MGIYNYALISLLTEDEELASGAHSKDEVIDKINSQFSLIKDRSVYYCDDFAVRVCSSKTHSFSNTVLSLSALQKFDDRPFLVCLTTPDGCEFFLANSTFLKKISHSSHELRVDNIKGSFNGSDIYRDYDGLSNIPSNFEELYAIHEAFTWEENVERLVEATNNISPNKSKFIVTASAEAILMDSPQRAAAFVSSPEYLDLKSDLWARTERVKDLIVVASLIDNVNLRGRVIEELITTDNPNIIRTIARKLKNNEMLELKTDQKLGDYTKTYEAYKTETDIKTKILFLQSAPKAYNIDKLLSFLAEEDSVYLFYLIGITDNDEIKTHLVSAFQSDLVSTTRVQRHWAGRNSRGVTQLDGSTLDDIIEYGLEDVDVNKARAFLRMLINL